MSTYALSGSGTQLLTAGTTALHVSITTLSPYGGVGNANPTNHFHQALLRPGDGTGFWAPIPVEGGPQWIGLPNGTDRIGYACEGGSHISVVEVIGGTSPFAGPPGSTGATGPAGAAGPGVAVGGTNGQVLQKNSSTNFDTSWQTPSTAPAFDGARYNTASTQAVPSGTLTIINYDTVVYDPNARVATGTTWHFTVGTTGYYHINAGVILQGASEPTGTALDLFVFVNGTQTVELARTAGNGGVSNFSAFGGATLKLTAGDTVDVRAYQSTSGSISLFSAADRNYVNIERVG